jgi:hypothetical protein
MQQSFMLCFLFYTPPAWLVGPSLAGACWPHQVCSRLGLPLAFKVLDEGRYCLAWPADRQQQQLMMAAGEQVVVDVYGRGGLLTVTEVRW